MAPVVGALALRLYPRQSSEGHSMHFLFRRLEGGLTPAPPGAVPGSPGVRDAQPLSIQQRPSADCSAPPSGRPRTAVSGGGGGDRRAANRERKNFAPGTGAA